MNQKKRNIQQKGFRLQYLEIFNWGTFDEKIWKLQPNGNNSLLTGANGSGKTTLVDAIITLLVPPQNRHYNQSSGSKSKRERDEKTYTRGAYVTVQGDSGLAAKTKYLRDRDAFSILLGTFYNPDIKEYVTLAQVRWFGNNELKRVYLIIPSALTISEHFQPMDTGGVWKRELKKWHKAEEFSSFSKYAQRFSKMFGLKSEKALTLFAQTVGIKVLGNLNDFIRQNMLETYDAEQEFQKLYEHYENLLRSHKAIEKAREQLRLLNPIVEGGEQFETLSKTVAELQNLEECITPFFAQEKIHLYQKNCQNTSNDIQKKNSQIDALKEQIQNLYTQQNDLQVSISTNEVYGQLQNLDKQIQQTEQELQRRRKHAQRYNDIANYLELKSDPNEKTFYKILDQCQRDKDDTEATIESIQNDEIQLQLQSERLRENIKQKEEQLVSLQQRQNRIPLEQITIRKQLMDKLGLKESDVPFAAELFKVKEEAQEWEVVLEKVFRPIGLTLLVKETHYDKVLSFAHRAKLESKISFLKVPELDKEKIKSTSDKKSILQKIAFKTNNSYAIWLEKYLFENYNYTSVKGYTDLQKNRKAVNEKGLLKNHLYHERNERVGESGNENYILGWDNRSTILLLQRQVKEEEAAAEKLRQSIKSNRTRRNALSEKRDHLLQLSGFQQFLEIDWKGSTKIMKTFQTEKDTLLKSSNQLKELEQQIQQVKANISDHENQKDKLIEQRGNLQSRLENYTQKQQEAEDVVRQYKDIAFKKQKTAILELIPEDERRFLVSNIERIENKTTKDFNRQKEKQIRDLTKVEQKLVMAMQNFTQPKPEIMLLYPDWTVETTNLVPKVTYLDQFGAMYKRISEEDLPKYQTRFKDWLNERMIFDIANFKTALENQESQILDSIEQINSSLLEIDFNNTPKTYIQLDINKTRDAAVRDFKQLLRDAMPDPAKLIKGDEQELEYSFKKIKRIIEELSANEQWRKKVTDVRNWLEFAADERHRDDNTQRQYYVDSQSLSGGEKAKLAYTILASAIAYQFGIRNEGRRAKSFRFAVVDEAFSKVDPENSVYAMELFKQLNLQLMVVTPLDKINLAEPYIRSVHFVQNRAKRNSEVFDLPMEIYQQQKESFKETSTSQEKGQNQE